MRVVTTVPLDTGLNNQKICIVGAFHLAEAMEARLALRPGIIDYRPSRRRPVRELPLGELFDEPALAAAVGALWTDAPADELLTMAACFAAGNRALARTSADGLAARIMRSLAPAPALAETAARLWTLLDHRSGGACAAVQLRIERDWVEYLNRKEIARPDGASLSMTDPDRIFRKIRATPYMHHTTTLYACCDESDLGQSVAELKRIAAGHDFDLVFKSEAMLLLPESTIGKAIVDFALCQSVPIYIGLDRSTFSNMLLRLRTWSGSRQRHYRYNSDHVLLKLRTEPIAPPLP